MASGPGVPAREQTLTHGREIFFTIKNEAVTFRHTYSKTAVYSLAVWTTSGFSLFIRKFGIYLYSVSRYKLYIAKWSLTHLSYEALSNVRSPSTFSNRLQDGGRFSQSYSVYILGSIAFKRFVGFLFWRNIFSGQWSFPQLEYFKFVPISYHFLTKRPPTYENPLFCCTSLVCFC